VVGDPVASVLANSLLEETFSGQTGSYRWHLGRAVPLRNPEGTIVKWFGTNTDIDETRKMRDELRRSRAIP
jgi:PAS domain-containing protein